LKDYSDVYRQKTPQSEALFKRAREVMPGGISHNITISALSIFVKYANAPRSGM
jgi:hypothetical protein